MFGGARSEHLSRPEQNTWSPAALTIAGADSSGGAGLAADLRAFAASGVHGAFALTLVSAQNTAEFRAAQPVDAELVAAQIHAVLDDMPIAAAKTGLLLTAETVAAVASVAARRLPQLVVDPVLVDGAGEPMLSPEAERSVATRLLPSARVVTPNHLEAGRLLGSDLSDEVEAWIDAAHELAAAGPEAVIVTGGRLRTGETITDVVVCSGKVRLLSAPRIDTRNVRGSGDVFSAAICAELAKGTGLDAAIDRAHDLTTRAISAGATRRLGSGRGPVDPFAA
ncbi:bifunctional hydroxymethylpyrimidine kinase/phosphomethylpyrimidine kinase [Candidatus Poriferisodalis sp.]|uniref:bifunctional hydroxymethylpyrimidine kinase/phosphomethylpyrimidine kinase n=1 Tax=Candidatus Poriferisodalis sp. TaxID=3101277 RepID=UPI003B01F77E